MTQTEHQAVLRRKVRRSAQSDDAPPVTTSRALRLALSKSAEASLGLAISVTSIEDRIVPLDDSLDHLDDDLMLIGLDTDTGTTGLIGVDVELRAAVVEMRTRGAVVDRPATPRAATSVDRRLVEPLLAAFLEQLGGAIAQTPLEGWGASCKAGQPFGSARLAALALADQDYRSMVFTVAIDGTDRQGAVVVMLPPVVPEAQPEPVPQPDWAEAFQAQVSKAPAKLTAVLHRFDMSLADMRTLAVGTVVPLVGGDLGETLLVSPDGKIAATGKLGQAGGRRAVRVQPISIPELEDLTPQPPSDPPLSVLPASGDTAIPVDQDIGA